MTRNNYNGKKGSRPIFLVVIIFLSFSYSTDNGLSDTEIISLNKNLDLRDLALNFPVDPLMVEGQKIYFQVEKKHLEGIRQAGYFFSLETHRFNPQISPGHSIKLRWQGGLNGAYHSYQELESELQALVRAYPSITRLYILGKSLENRNIYALKISDNVSTRENEPAITFLGGHHAREWISLEIPLLIGKHLLENYTSDDRIKFLVDSAEIWVIPLVNPDGLQYSILNYRLWRKNRRLNYDGSYGVDLNRNYSFAWAYDSLGSSPNPSSADYRGLEPFSEPETRAINNFFHNHNLAAAISYHSFSQSILYPWGYLDQATEDEPLFQQLSAAMAELIYQVNGRIYETGRAAAALYLTNGDFADWAYAFFQIPAFTIELPPLDLAQGGFVNSEADIDEIFQENLPPALFLIDWVIANYEETIPERPPYFYLKRELEKRLEIIVKDRKSSGFLGKEQGVK